MNIENFVLNSNSEKIKRNTGIGGMLIKTVQLLPIVLAVIITVVCCINKNMSKKKKIIVLSIVWIIAITIYYITSSIYPVHEVY